MYNVHVHVQHTHVCTCIYMCMYMCMCIQVQVYLLGAWCYNSIQHCANVLKPHWNVTPRHASSHALTTGFLAVRSCRMHLKTVSFSSISSFRGRPCRRTGTTWMNTYIHITKATHTHIIKWMHTTTPLYSDCPPPPPKGSFFNEMHFKCDIEEIKQEGPGGYSYKNTQTHMKIHNVHFSTAI